MTEPRVLDDLLLDACVGCGCRDDHACADGCSWEIPYLLCSTCAADPEAAITGWINRSADAIARLVAWKRDVGVDDVAQLELGLREVLIAVALPDTPILPVPDSEGGPPHQLTNDGSSDLNTSAGREMPRPARSSVAEA